MNSNNRFQRNRGFRYNVQNRYTNKGLPLKRKRENDESVEQNIQFPKNNNSDYFQEEHEDQSKLNQPSTSSNISQTTWKWNKTDDFQSNSKRVYENNYNKNNFSDSLHNDEQQSRFAVPKIKEYYKNTLSSGAYNTKYSANNRLKLLRENISKSPSDHVLNKFVPSDHVPNKFVPNDHVPNTFVPSDYVPNKFVPSDRVPIKFPPSDNVSNKFVPSHTKPRPNYIAKPSTMQARISKYKNVATENKFDIDTKLSNYVSHAASTSALNNTFTLPYNSIFENNKPPVIVNNQEDDIEYMEWSSIDVQEVLVNLEDIRRNNTDDKKFVPKTPLQHTFANCSTEMQLNKNLCKALYIVIDTNIFISDLVLVKQLLKLKINGVVSPILFIPWMVIQELDYLKDGRSGDKLKRPASWAVKFINNELSSKNPQLQGQSVRDAAKVSLSSKSPDDGILFCLLQIVENGNRPYLLSNDINLRNKAILNEIEAYGQGEILKKLDPYDNNKLRSNTMKEESEDLKQIKLHLSNLFSYVILKEVHECYSAPPTEIANSPPPWSLLECLNLFKSYWGPIFTYKLQKQCINTIENFVQLIKEENYGVTNGFKENLLDLGLGLCIYIKNGLTKYSETVNECIMKIEQEKETFSY